MAYWLLKSEPDVFSIDDLQRDRTTTWDGVRNYQARNHQLKMKKGELALFYHSRSEPPGVAGLCRISKKAFPDATAFDPQAKYYDPKSDPKTPRWFNVEVEYVCHLPRPVPLQEIRANRSLKTMVLVNNSRLSVQPVTLAAFRKICIMGGLPDIPGKEKLAGQERDRKGT
jgi:predicted RNA-binding protein with PUA-like domain